MTQDVVKSSTWDVVTNCAQRHAGSIAMDDVAMDCQVYPAMVPTVSHFHCV